MTQSVYIPDFTASVKPPDVARVMFITGREYRNFIEGKRVPRRSFDQSFDGARRSRKTRKPLAEPRLPRFPPVFPRFFPVFPPFFPRSFPVFPPFFSPFFPRLAEAVGTEPQAGTQGRETAGNPGPRVPNSALRSTLLMLKG